MTRRVFAVFGGIALGLVSASAQQLPAATRAIRRDLPMTNAIRAAFEAGTRDASGNPGPNYWQLETDYTINVSLDPARHTLTGTETIVLKNNSPAELTQIALRLDHNIFRGRVPRGMSVPAENTDGMVVTKARAVVQQRRQDRASRRRVLLEALGAVPVCAVDDAGRPKRGHGISDGGQLEFRRGRS